MKLDFIEDKVREIGGSFIIAGDLNAKAIEWGEATTNTRGRCILDMAARLGLIVANIGGASTFRRPGCEFTRPDVTLVSESLAGYIQGWSVLEDYMGSDHHYIAFQIERSVAPPPTQRIRGTRKWNVDKLNFETFLANFDRPTSMRSPSDADYQADSIMQRIIQSCNASMPRVSHKSRRRPSYWWTSEIAELRRACLRNRRIYIRARRRGQALQEAEDFKRSRKLLKQAITASKKRKWEELRNELNSNPWGLAYKIVVRKLGANSETPQLNSETIDIIVRNLFPSHPPLEVVLESLSDEIYQPFTEDELKTAAKSLRPGKAPGPDGVPVEVIKLLAENRSDALLGVFNTCLEQGIFPRSWKVQKLTLISKGGSNPHQPSSYRPLCMLDTAGKLLEKLLQHRLADAVERAGGLSKRQYGFRPGMSTLDAIEDVVKRIERVQRGRSYPKRIIVVATLDVRNAFNSLRWRDIIRALRDRFCIPSYLLRIIQSYMRDRKLIYHTPEGKRAVEITSGAAQGSILGPTLWNISYDEILSIEMPEDTELIGYADDIVAVISARDTDDAQRKLHQVMIRSQTWLEDHGLELARNKTEVILMTKAHIQLEVNMLMDDVSLVTQRTVKYLGVRLDCRLTYWAHIQYVSAKAAKLTGMLSKLMANIGGPTQNKRRLIMAVTNSVLLYGCEIWGHALEMKSKRKALEAVQRTAALRVASAYRTVSGPAVLLISGEIPVDLLARERKEAWDARRETNNINAAELRSRTMRRWQNRWNSDARGRWTRKLIPSIEKWAQRSFGEVNYYLTQFLSGHGYFRQYLYRMGKVENPSCIYCDTTNDDAEHTFFSCTRWHLERSELEVQIGYFTPNNIVDKMLASEVKWRAVAKYIETLLRKKKVELDATG